MDERYAPLNAIAFTDAVKAAQVRRGSRGADGHSNFEGNFRAAVRPHLEAFLADVDTAYLATANTRGQPYAQHRGGPRGFIKALDDATIGFADYRGNRQYITTGNLAENDKAFLFLMDYANRRRIKIWGSARMVEDAAIVDAVRDPAYAASVERALVFTVHAWDANCPQHIPQKIDAVAVMQALERKDERIRQLEAELAVLQAGTKAWPP